MHKIKKLIGIALLALVILNSGNSTHYSTKINSANAAGPTNFVQDTTDTQAAKDAKAQAEAQKLNDIIDPYDKAMAELDKEYEPSAYAKKAEEKANAEKAAAAANEAAQVSGSGYNESGTPRTLVPSTDRSEKDCFELLNQIQVHTLNELKSTSSANLKGTSFESQGVSETDVLACAFKTGKFQLWMIPLLIIYFIDFLLSVAGLIAVLFLIIGGYMYMFGGLSEDKEKGKKAILYGIVGFVVALLAWTIVNAVQILVTS